MEEFCNEEKRLEEQQIQTAQNVFSNCSAGAVGVTTTRRKRFDLDLQKGSI